MDVDHSGYVTRGQFMDFRRTEPQLQLVVPVYEKVPRHDLKQTRPLEDETGWQRTATTWEELCCGKENLEWKEFLFFFRRRGWLADYKLKDGAKRDRARVAAILTEFRTKDLMQDGQTPDKLLRLRGSHLQEKQNWQPGLTARLDKPWALENAGRSLLKPPLNESSTTASVSGRSSRSTPCSESV
jgi:hypothetical protein